MYSSTNDKIYVIIVRFENIYGRYCDQSKNDHFHQQFAIIVFKIRSPSFTVV